MSEVLDGVIAAFGRALDEKSRAKIQRYLETLSSTGKTDLTTYGLSRTAPQLRPRYTGC